MLSLILIVDAYFPAKNNEDILWLRDPFNAKFDSLKLSFEEQDELINLSCDDELATVFKTSTLERFWCNQITEYSHLAS